MAKLALKMIPAALLHWKSRVYSRTAPGFARLGLAEHANDFVADHVMTFRQISGAGVSPTLVKRHQVAILALARVFDTGAVPTTPQYQKRDP